MDSPDASKSTALTDDRLAITIAFLLRAGVVTSAMIVAAGGIAYLIQHQGAVAYANFHPERGSLRSIPGVVRSALQLRTDAVIQLGLLVLIATPIARVVLAFIGFWLQRDRLYVVVSLIVLAILTYSVIHAL